MFTHAQLALLRISALVCLGFILGVSAMSPSVNPFIERDAGIVADSATVEHRDQVEQRRLGRDGATDCSDLNSASCRELRTAYESYLGQVRERNENEAPDRLRSEAVEKAGSGRFHGIDEGHTELRVVTVYNGSLASEFVVPRETN